MAKIPQSFKTKLTTPLFSESPTCSPVEVWGLRVTYPRQSPLRTSQPLLTTSKNQPYPAFTNPLNNWLTPVVREIGQGGQINWSTLPVTPPSPPLTLGQSVKNLSLRKNFKATTPSINTYYFQNTKVQWIQYERKRASDWEKEGTY